MEKPDEDTLRDLFENKMKELGYPEETFEQDEHGYIMMDIAIQFSSFKMGYLAAIEELDA